MKRSTKLFGLLGIMFTAILANLLAFYTPVSAAGDIQYVDKAMVIYDGQKYVDENPYDNFREWKRGPSSCASFIRDSDDGNGTENVAKVVIKHNGADGSCVTDSETNNVQMTNTDRRNVNSYRVNDETLFLPIGLKRFGCGDGLGGDVASQSLVKSPSNRLERGRFFKKLPAEDRPNGPKNEYLLVNEDGTLNNKVVLITNSDGTASARIIGICLGIDETQTLFENDIRISVASIPNEWGVDPEADTPTESTNAEVTSEAEPSCAVTSTNPASWALCPIVNGLGDLTDWLFNQFILPLLKVSPIVIEPGTPVFNVWSGFRVIANIILVIVFLLMIFGQAIGGGLVDAYTVKKVMPRIVIGAIGINLSIYLAAIMVDITNVIGNGIGLLITGPFLERQDQNAQEFTIGGLSSVITVVIVILTVGGSIYAIKRAGKRPDAAGPLRKSAFAGVLKSALAWILLFIGIPVAIAAISIFVTLLLRAGIIVLFSVASPIAIALWILPSTEQYFKKWFNMFLRALMVYPIVVIFFAMGDVLAYAFGGNMLDNPDPLGVNGVVAIFAQFIPLFMIGYAFKIAGGVLGAINETIAKRGKQAGEFIKGNEQDPNSLRRRRRDELGDKILAGRERFRDNNLSSKSRTMRGLARLANSGNIDIRRARRTAEEQKYWEALTASGPDDLVRGAFLRQTEDGGWYRLSDVETHEDGNGGFTYTKKEGASEVYGGGEEGRRKAAYWHEKSLAEMGKSKSRMQYALGYELKKAGGNPEKIGSLLGEGVGVHGERDGAAMRSILSTAGLTRKEGGDLATGVGFQYQNQFFHAKHRKWKDGGTNAAGEQVSGHWEYDMDSMMDEVVHMRGDYNAGQLDARTFGVIQDHYEDLQARQAAGERLTGNDIQTMERIEEFATQIDPSQRATAAGGANDLDVVGQDGEGNDIHGLAGYGINGAPVEVMKNVRSLVAAVPQGRRAAAKSRMGIPTQQAGGRPAPRGGERPGDVTAGVAGLGGNRPPAPLPPPQRPPGAPTGLGGDDPNDVGPI